MLGNLQTEALAQLLSQCIRVGIVTRTDPAQQTVRCRFPDADDMVSYPLRVLSHKSNQDKAYWMPDLDEHVLCLFLPYGREQGFVLGAFYSKADPVPAASQHKEHTKFRDGTVVEYDRQNHRLLVQCVGDVDVQASRVTVQAQDVKVEAQRVHVTAPDITLKGTVKVHGLLLAQQIGKL